MTRAQLEHVIRAAAAISGEDEIVVIGSQSVLGQFPSAPPELLVSNEADVYPRSRPERAELIDGSIGEGSMFHETFGYYAQGVGPETAVLPRGWESRLVAVRGPATRGATGWCLELHDLIVAKLVAGREKDLDFATAAARHGLLDGELLRARLAETEVGAELRPHLDARARAVMAALSAAR
jgi:hypothetical protein